MITVLFSCNQCSLVDAHCLVKDRPKEMDVVYWMKEVMTPELVKQHTRLSLLCESTQLVNVKIPIPQDDDPDGWIGKQVENVPPKGELNADPS